MCLKKPTLIFQAKKHALIELCKDLDVDQLLLLLVSLILKRIVQFFHFSISGDGSDEEMAAKQMNFPFWRINGHNDLAALNNALDMQFI